MMKYIYTFILILMGYSCETSSNKPEDTKNEAVKIEASPVEVLNEASTVHPKDGFNAQEFCACVDSIGINDCMYEYDRVRGISIDTFIVETPCYQEKVLKPKAQYMCDCLNSLKQASMDCDRLQEKYDQLHTVRQQEIILEFFKAMDCGENN